MSEKTPRDFEIVSNTPDVGFIDNHPSPTAGGKFKGKDLPSYAGSDGQESKYFKCPHCGFYINRNRNTQGSGWGNDTTQAITTIAGGTANAREPISSAGCPFCNASNW